MGATASKLSDAIAVENIGDIVMDYDHANRIESDRKERDLWLRSTKKDK